MSAYPQGMDKQRLAIEPLLGPQEKIGKKKMAGQPITNSFMGILHYPLYSFGRNPILRHLWPKLSYSRNRDIETTDILEQPTW